MSTTPDPTIVREIAREQILNHVRNLAQDDERVYESVIEKDVCESLTDDEQQALTDDVLAAIERAAVTVSWPDEHPQDERDAKPGPYRLRDLTDDEARVLRARYEASEAARDVADLLSDENLDAHRISASIQAAIRQVRADLAQAQAEHDGDVRAVAALLAAVRVQGVPAATKRRAERLEIRFADRIADLEARDAKAGG